MDLDKKSTDYYDHVDLDEEFDFDKAKLQSGVGCQNPIKTAMAIGLKELQDKLDNKEQ